MHDRPYFQKALVTEGAKLAPVQRGLVLPVMCMHTYTGDNGPEFFESI